LLDRIQGYGKVVYMNNDMPNNIDNRRKFVQFISQEIHRFHLLPFSREACIAIIDEARRKSDKKDYLTCKFRPMISIIKTASVLARNENKEVVEVKHVEEALREHCKSIGFQVMEKMIEEQELYLTTVNPNAEPIIGKVHGLGVAELGEEMIGEVAALKASMIKREEKDFKKTGRQGYFTVTGASPKDDSYIQHSIAKVRNVILQKYGIDIAQDYFTHIDFVQEHNVEGPSAGVTMTVALCSIIDNKPLRQDIAITGEINIATNNIIEITPIGGTYEKIKAAEKWGFKGVIIPKRNYEVSINPKDFKIKVYYGETLEDYLKILYSEDAEN